MITKVHPEHHLKKPTLHYSVVLQISSSLKEKSTRIFGWAEEGIRTVLDILQNMKDKLINQIEQKPFAATGTEYIILGRAAAKVSANL